MDSIIKEYFDIFRNNIELIGGKPIVDEDFGNFIKKLPDENENALARMMLTLAIEPRVIEYEFTDEISCPSIIGHEVIDILNSPELTRNWIMSFPKKGRKVYGIHVKGTINSDKERNEGDVFFFFTCEDEGIKPLLYCALGLNDEELALYTKDNLNCSEPLCLAICYWNLFLNREKNYVTINHSKKNKGHNKGMVFNKNKPLVQYISLTEEGRHYVQQHNQSANQSFRNGKITIEVNVNSFVRNQWVGHGNDKHLEPRHVCSFERKQWIVPRDKIVKVSA